MKKQRANRLPFTVPENYFEDFSAKFDNTVLQHSPRPRRYFRLWMSVAAALVGLVLLTEISVLLYDRYLERNNAEYELFVLSQVDSDVYYDYLVSANE